MEPKVLVVEDDRATQDGWNTTLKGLVNLVSAYTIEEAREAFTANPDIVAIVMDGCVPGDGDLDNPNTRSLVCDLRLTFKGPIIAASGSPYYGNLLVEAGCTYRCEKKDVPRKILDILDIK